MPPRVMWRPSPAAVEQSAMMSFARAVSRRHPGRRVQTYPELHAWSVESSDAFWRLALEELGLLVSGDPDPVREGTQMPDVRFFPNLGLNAAQNLLRWAERTPSAPALVSVTESRDTRRVSYGELSRRVAKVAARLRAMGVGPGDRVAAYVSNVSESVVGMLATAALGATWSSCSPDFGVQGVLDRFGQIGPKVLLGSNGYRYAGKDHRCLDKLGGVAAALPTVEHVVVVDVLPEAGTALEVAGKHVWSFDELLAGPADELPFPHFPFDHPLYILYSSGTTGVPKCIVHGAGGTLLQHAKELVLHCGLGPGDRIMYFTTCGWMMWNWLVSALFTGATVVLYDGSPAHPDPLHLWRLASDERLTHLGTSPKFLGACRDRVVPREACKLQALRVLLSTGAPLLPEDFDWVYRDVKPDLMLASISGGTDIVSCFMLGNPTLPVVRGEIQAFGLGMDVAAYDADDRPVLGARGELVCRTPFPSAPVSFWNDPDRRAYRDAYFRGAPGVWYHGDYIEVTGSQGPCGGVVVYGRSDATLNPGGVRIGTAEIYRLVETLPEVDDSIVVAVPAGGDVEVQLYVKLREGAALTEALIDTIRGTLRAGASPRHVPAVIRAVGAIPYTISGKKVEVAVRQVLCGERPPNEAALQNPEALDEFRRYSPSAPPSAPA